MITKIRLSSNVDSLFLLIFMDVFKFVFGSGYSLRMASAGDMLVTK